jgi:ABC-type amino acid transport substrate-binding protein
VAPAGIFVPQASPIRDPEDLAGVPVSVGYQSGSHYATLQALEQYLPREQINLSFGEGMLFKRLDNLLEGRSQASTLFSGPYYLAEQMGYRKVIDTTFMIASMITGTPSAEDLRRFYRALKRAQRDIDLQARALHALLQERVPRPLSRRDGHAALGAGRAHRVRALHRGRLR